VLGKKRKRRRAAFSGTVRRMGLRPRLLASFEVEIRHRPTFVGDAGVIDAVNVAPSGNAPIAGAFFALRE
jgi:hypothetical protein